MENLKNELINEYKRDLHRQLKQIKTEEGLKNLMSFYGRVYKNNSKEKLIKYLTKQNEKRLNAYLNQIEVISKAEDFKEDFVITIEWKKSRMWGSNPKAYTNEGFTSESIGGCGYCKLSTATAYALNSNLSILKLLYEKKNRDIKNFKGKDKKNSYNREVLGYGSGYNVLPSFEGGVGVRSHEIICEGVGLVMEQISDTNSTDVYLIKKKVA